MLPADVPSNLTRCQLDAFWARLCYRELKDDEFPAEPCSDIVISNAAPAGDRGFKQTLGGVEPRSRRRARSNPPPTSKLLSSESLNSGQELFKRFRLPKQFLW